MNQAFHLLKAVSLMLLLADLFGCAGQQSGSMTSNVSEAVHKGMQGVSDFVRPMFEKGQVRNVDKYCDSLEESYEITDNVMRVVSAAGLQSLQDWQKSGFKRSPKGNSDVNEVVKTVSKNYLWMPVSFEQTLGNQLHERQEKANKILDRKAKRNQKLYNKADAAPKIAAKDYTKLPYETKLYIVDSDQINAEALPAGYIYVTRKAANDLDDNALQYIMDTRSMQAIDKVFAGGRVIESFNGLFAKYDQEQELQADACSIRGMLRAGADPLKAREEYLRKRGTKEDEGGSSKPTSPKVFGLGFTDHPEDKERDRFFQEAYQHHLHKKEAALDLRWKAIG